MSCIRVICRLRPENRIEKENGGAACVNYTSDTLRILIQDRSDEYHDFSFDNIFGPDSTQEKVFTTAAKPIIDGVLDGYNGTIFAYGQTGSGKTYTMEGPDISKSDSKGIIPRMMDELFQGLINASESTEFTLRVSFLEIYLERIHDLIDTSKTNLQVKEDKQRGIFVQNATEIYVSSPAEMMKVMAAGSANRSIAATRMNERSSRSHSIFCVNVEQRDLQGNRKSGRLYFVDLAGSESIGKTCVSGQQLKEAMMINKSLSALGNVINALTDKANGFVPYRDSKLTRILQESIGGNSQTSLIIACSMSSYNSRETLSTLRFGQRAKKIQNKPVVNQERSGKELLKKIEQIQGEVKKQAEIINAIHKHLQANHADKPKLLEEISEIINETFEVQEKAANDPQDSEYALRLLKQHIEIVQLHEELEGVKSEKKELEEDLSFRIKELSDLEVQMSELDQNLVQERKTVEELQGQIEKPLRDSQIAEAGQGKIVKVCERLQSDLSLIKNTMPTTQKWSEILSKSLSEAIASLKTISDIDPPAYLNESEILKHIDYETQLNKITEELKIKTKEAETWKGQIHQQSIQISQLKTDCELLSKQLDTKVKNIEEERASTALEMKYKDLEIFDLKESLKHEREKVENIKANSPEVQVSDTQDRLEELCYERQKLFEEIVTLRRDLDLREEQLHNALQKSKRIERQLSIQNNKNTGSFSRAFSPVLMEGGFTKKVSKPIRGGGGDFSNFQRNNQIISFNNDSLIKNRKSIEKISNQGGLQSMIKDLFGGLLG